ncbi:MAG: hypothetical protein ABSC54_05095 [Smithellaceae bacterium]|jgi:hypothetical protein
MMIRCNQTEPRCFDVCKTVFSLFDELQRFDLPSFTLEDILDILET